jgi:ribonuclease J
VLRIIPIGGLGEIGLNTMVLEYKDSILVIDAGIMFPDDYTPGVDIIIPDFSYLKQKKEFVKGLILTHGHEDHIGAAPFLLKELNIPVFGTAFTLELLKEKLKTYNVGPRNLVYVKAGDISHIDPFKIEYINVTHSIVDGVGLAIETPEGIIVHSGDFKIETSSVNNNGTDIARFAFYGKKGVLALLSDSTNAEKEGFSLTEREIKNTLESIFTRSEGRIIIASFATNIPRIQQIVNLASKFKRKVVFMGRNMVSAVTIAKKLGFLEIPQGVEITERQLPLYRENELVIITTGSQGEPMSALVRMAHSRYKYVKIKPGDTVILSSKFIPGNEAAITSIINLLYKLGADVVYETVADIHASGHAKREELKLMLSLVKPKYFIPIHGEYRHLVKHAQLAIDMGIPKENIMLLEDGDVVACEDGICWRDEKIATGKILIDGKGTGDIDDITLKERKKLSVHGMVIVVLVTDERTGEIIYGPDVISKGFILQEYREYLLEEAKCVVLEAFDDLDRSSIDWESVKSDIKRRLKGFFYNVVRKNPLIVPIIIHL